MAIHDSRLMRRVMVAEGTMAFHFSKPSGFRHEAGQSLLVTLVNPPETDGEGMPAPSPSPAHPTKPN